jgi:hypothetical protein
MKVMFLSETDYASVGYLFAQSLRSVGINSVALAKSPRSARKHAPYDIYYGKDHTIVSKYIKECDVIVWMHSAFIKLKRYVPSIRGKKLAVFHGGSRYRNDPKRWNKIFNPRASVSLIQTYNLLGLGAKNEKWILPPVDIESILPNYTPRSNTYPKDQRFYIGHYPSSPEAKNSAEINEVMARLEHDPYIGNRFVYDYSDKLVPWKENLQRIRGCDIYIESLSKEINGKVTDDWGVTALEAAASGCVVLSVFRSSEAYLREHGSSAAVLRLNDGEDLEKHIRKLVGGTREELFNLQEASRGWVEEHHSYKAVGRRLKKALGI